MSLKKCHLTEIVCLLTFLVLILVQNGCESSNEVFKKELEDLFGDDKDMRNALTDYLDAVPTSHKSHASAMRIMNSCSSCNSKNAYHSKSNLVKGRGQNHLASVIGSIFENFSSGSCREECTPCPPPRPCVPCDKECKKCPPCPVPDYCPMPKPNEKCPPPPECPVCPEDKPQNITESLISGQRSSIADQQYNKINKRLTDLKKKNELRLKANQDRLKQNQMRFKENQGERLKKMGVKVKNPVKIEKHQSHNQQSQLINNDHKAWASAKATTSVNRKTTKKPKTTTSKPQVTTVKPQDSTTKEPEEPIRIVTSSSSSSSSASSSGSELTGTKTFNFNDSSTTVKNVIVNPDGSKTITVTTTTTTVAAFYGTYLFEKNLNLLVSNETIREQINKMIDEIPNSTGGKEMELAEKLMARFGERQVKPIKKMGSSRMFTYLKSRGNVRCILGHLFELFRRKKCKCEVCKVPELCKCDKPKDCKENQKCPACPPQTAPCPAPVECKTYPPCKVCKTNPISPADDPNYDGTSGDLDDVDKENVVKEGELSEEQVPIGFTRDFQASCGIADLNPLTPKIKRRGYMNGGENQVYGEWPSFARLDIRVPDFKNMVGLCGGVLISDRHILTAGHCVRATVNDEPVQIGPENFKVYLGDHKKKEKDEFEQQLDVSSVCRSTKFFDPNGQGSRYDYAVLTLSTNVTFNDHIQPACLPYKPVNQDKISQCYVVGLGITKYSKQLNHTIPATVQKMRLIRTSCKDWGIKHDDRSRHCFTKYGNQGDTCGGDSGGPILCLNEANRWTIAGLVSYGSEACDGTESSGWIAVYTRVQALLHQMHLDCEI